MNSFSGDSFTGTSDTWPIMLTDGDLILRPLRRSDAWEWDGLRSRNAHWLAPWDATSPTRSGDGSSGPARMSFGRYVRMMNREARRGGSFPWAIAIMDPGATNAVLAGQLTVAPVQWGSALSATIGYWVDQDRAGQGIMPRAVALAGDFLFQRIGMHRIEINIVPDNDRSHRVVEKLGFRFEGVRRKYLHIAGEWKDHDSFALTVEDLDEGGLRGRLDR